MSDEQTAQVAASEIPASSRNVALSKLASELQKLVAKENLISGSVAADTQAEILKQREEANKLQTSENNNTRTTGASENDNKRTTGASEANNKRTTGASEADNKRTTTTTRTDAQEKNQDTYNLLPKKEQAKGASEIQSIRQYAGALKGTRAEKVKTLTEGEPEQSVKAANGDT